MPVLAAIPRIHADSQQHQHANPRQLFTVHTVQKDSEEIGSLIWEDVDLSTPEPLCELFGSILPAMVYLEIPNGEKLAESLHSKGEHSMPWNLHQGLATSNRLPVIIPIKNEDMLSISVRRGVDIGQSHNQWLSTISQSPNVISMFFVPIISLLGGVRGNGFLTHAMNLYLQCAYISPSTVILVSILHYFPTVAQPPFSEGNVVPTMHYIKVIMKHTILDILESETYHSP